jgi:peptidyl-prolyl cis-trans isomerase C
MKRFRMWQRTLAAAVVLGIALMPVMAVGDKDKADPKPANAALVNGKPVAYQDFEWELELYNRRLQSQGMQIPEHLQVQVRKEVIDELVNRELIFQESVKKGVAIEPEQVEKELDAIKQRYPDKKEFDAIMSSMKMSEERLKSQIAQRSAITALIEQEIVSKIEISDAEIQSFYDDNTQLFERPEEVRASHILIRVAQDAGQEEKAEARKALAEVRTKAEAGEDFAELARAHSQCPSAQNGGDLGYFSKGKMVPAFEKAAFELEPDKVSDIVETDFGYHLIKVTDRRAAGTIGFDEVRPRIATNLRNERIQADLVEYLEQLRESATIEMFVY